MSHHNTLNQIFNAYARIGNGNTDSTTISWPQAERWLGEARILDKVANGKQIADKFNKTKTEMGFPEFMKFIESLSETIKLTPPELMKLLSLVELPIQNTTDSGRSSIIPPNLTPLLANEVQNTKAAKLMETNSIRDSSASDREPSIQLGSPIEPIDLSLHGTVLPDVPEHAIMATPAAEQPTPTLSPDDMKQMLFGGFDSPSATPNRPLPNSRQPKETKNIKK